MSNCRFFKVLSSFLQLLLAFRDVCIVWTNVYSVISLVFGVCPFTQCYKCPTISPMYIIYVASVYGYATIFLVILIFLFLVILPKLLHRLV